MGEQRARGVGRLRFADDHVGLPALHLRWGNNLQPSSVAPAGGTCTAKGKPCWAAKKSSFVYTDSKELTPDGLASVVLKAGTRPKQATINFVGKKARLQSPALPLVTPLTVRVQRSDGASCYEAVFSTPKKNVIGKLTGKSD